jgi:hypothetical protein
MSISEYIGAVARSSTTSNVFNAIGDARRRENLDALITGEKTVGTIVNDVSMSQPQDRLDRMDDYLKELQHQGEQQ